MFDVYYGDKFTIEFQHFPKNLQDAVLDFTDLVEEHGLGSHNKNKGIYKGKISHSWRNLDPSDPDYAYTYSNSLWHYHVGIPAYIPSRHGNYYTSDMVLHFVWKKDETKILIVDCTEHYNAYGKFWLPRPAYLLQTPP